MKNRQSIKKLALNKLTISKLNNPSSIQGGRGGVLGITDMTGMTSSCQPTGCPPPPPPTMVDC
ncbi:class I lanthipeptide [Dokdonia sp.]|uniref:class I lanthipeptide n=1 Tax=Dokdonia sp. TaxID=2024995 RepID=UPI003265D6D4